MSRTVCGECWMPYGDSGECGCPSAKPAMTCAQLADELVAPIGKSGQSTHAICKQAAALIRRQHEAIKVLRSCLKWYLDEHGVMDKNMGAKWMEDNAFWIAGQQRARQALADTEEFK